MVEVPAESWLKFWHGWTWFILGCAIVVTVWLTIGGILDMKMLYRLLRSRRADVADDGRVGAEAPAVGASTPPSSGSSRA